MRKLIRRTLLIAATLFGVGLITAVIVGFLAIQQPEFYASLRNQGEADPAIKVEMDEKARDFEDWAMRSVALGLSEHSSHVPVNAPPGNLASAPDTFRFELTEKQLNATLAAHGFGSGDVGNPRIRILDDMLRLGAEIQVGDSCLVFSGDLKPQITSEGALRLEITNAYMGSLPFPLHSVLNLMSQHVKLSDSKLQLDLTGQTPVITVNVSKSRRPSPDVKAIHCTDGSMAIEFQAPNRDQIENPSAAQRPNRASETTMR